ncbi:MAG: hypothetical protein ACLTZK_10380 [Turicibacter sp.]
MSTKDFNLDLVEVSKSNTGASARITNIHFVHQDVLLVDLWDVNSKVLDVMFMYISANSVIIV